jgi:hypothetical protein
MPSSKKKASKASKGRSRTITFKGDAARVLFAHLLVDRKGPAALSRTGGPIRRDIEQILKALGHKIPTLEEVEAKLGPAVEWAGRCYEIASACVAEGLVDGVAVYGHYVGKVHPKSHFGVRAGMPFVQHGWVKLTGDEGLIFDPTRFAFEAREPYLYVGKNEGDYDEGGNGMRKAFKRPAPPFDASTSRVVNFTSRVIASAAWQHVEKLLGPNYLIELDGHDPGELTMDQVFWLANLPYDELEPHAHEIYQAILKVGQEAAIPLDNLRRAAREAER